MGFYEYGKNRQTTPKRRERRDARRPGGSFLRPERRFEGSSEVKTDKKRVLRNRHFLKDSDLDKPYSEVNQVRGVSNHVRERYRSPHIAQNHQNGLTSSNRKKSNFQVFRPRNDNQAPNYHPKARRASIRRGQSVSTQRNSSKKAQKNFENEDQKERIQLQKIVQKGRGKLVCPPPTSENRPRLKNRLKFLGKIKKSENQQSQFLGNKNVKQRFSYQEGLRRSQEKRKEMSNRLTTLLSDQNRPNFQNFENRKNQPFYGNQGRVSEGVAGEDDLRRFFESSNLIESQNEVIKGQKLNFENLPENSQNQHQNVNSGSSWQDGGLRGSSQPRMLNFRQKSGNHPNTILGQNGQLYDQNGAREASDGRNVFAQGGGRVSDQVFIREMAALGRNDPFDKTDTIDKVSSQKPSSTTSRLSRDTSESSSDRDSSSESHKKRKKKKKRKKQKKDKKRKKKHKRDNQRRKKRPKRHRRVKKAEEMVQNLQNGFFGENGFQLNPMILNAFAAINGANQHGGQPQMFGNGFSAALNQYNQNLLAMYLQQQNQLSQLLMKQQWMERNQRRHQRHQNPVLWPLDQNFGPEMDFHTNRKKVKKSRKRGKREALRDVSSSDSSLERRKSGKNRRKRKKKGKRNLRQFKDFNEYYGQEKTTRMPSRPRKSPEIAQRVSKMPDSVQKLSREIQSKRAKKSNFESNRDDSEHKNNPKPSSKRAQVKRSSRRSKRAKNRSPSPESSLSPSIEAEYQDVDTEDLELRDEQSLASGSALSSRNQSKSKNLENSKSGNSAGSRSRRSEMKGLGRRKGSGISLKSGSVSARRLGRRKLEFFEDKENYAIKPSMRDRESNNGVIGHVSRDIGLQKVNRLSQRGLIHRRSQQETTPKLKFHQLEREQIYRETVRRIERLDQEHSPKPPNHSLMHQKSLQIAQIDQKAHNPRNSKMAQNESLRQRNSSFVLSRPSRYTDRPNSSSFLAQNQESQYPISSVRRATLAPDLHLNRDRLSQQRAQSDLNSTSRLLNRKISFLKKNPIFNDFGDLKNALAQEEPQATKEGPIDSIKQGFRPERSQSGSKMSLNSNMTDLRFKANSNSLALGDLDVSRQSGHQSFVVLPESTFEHENRHKLNFNSIPETSRFLASGGQNVLTEGTSEAVTIKIAQNDGFLVQKFTKNAKNRFSEIPGNSGIEANLGGLGGPQRSQSTSRGHRSGQSYHQIYQNDWEYQNSQNTTEVDSRPVAVIRRRRIVHRHPPVSLNAQKSPKNDKNGQNLWVRKSASLQALKQLNTSIGHRNASFSLNQTPFGSTRSRFDSEAISTRSKITTFSRDSGPNNHISGARLAQSNKLSSILANQSLISGQKLSKIDEAVEESNRKHRRNPGPQATPTHPGCPQSPYEASQMSQKDQQSGRKSMRRFSPKIQKNRSPSPATLNYHAHNTKHNTYYKKTLKERPESAENDEEPLITTYLNNRPKRSSRHSKAQKDLYSDTSPLADTKSTPRNPPKSLAEAFRENKQEMLLRFEKLKKEREMRLQYKYVRKSGIRTVSRTQKGRRRGFHHGEVSTKPFSIERKSRPPRNRSGLSGAKRSSKKGSRGSKVVKKSPLKRESMERLLRGEKSKMTRKEMISVNRRMRKMLMPGEFARRSVKAKRKREEFKKRQNRLREFSEVKSIFEVILGVVGSFKPLNVLIYCLKIVRTSERR